MSKADELLAANDLDGARAALVDAVRSDPSDQIARMFLLQLLFVCGEWDKAASQTRALAGLNPAAEMLAVLNNQLIAGERQREAAFDGSGPVNVLVPSSPWVEDLAGSIAAFVRGETDQGQALRDKAFSAVPDTPGECDGRQFGWIADADARFGPCLEAIVAGSWGLIPLEAIDALTSEGPTDLRDLVWLPVNLSLRSGQSAAAFIPTRYPGTTAAGSALRLAQGTEWVESASGDRGVGQRLFTFDDGTDAPLLSLRRLAMLRVD